MAVLRASRNGRVDPDAWSVAKDRVECERGVAFARDCVYNDISGSYTAAATEAGLGDPAAAERALGQSQIWWAEPPAMYEQLLFMVVQVHDELIVGALTENTGRVPREDLEMLLRGAERLLVAAAAGDIGLDQVGEITGVVPVTRGPGWLRVDSCWIELPEVQRLADDALPGSAARVFTVPDAHGEPTLVAYLTRIRRLHHPAAGPPGVHDPAAPARQAQAAGRQPVHRDHPRPLRHLRPRPRRPVRPGRVAASARPRPRHRPGTHMSEPKGAAPPGLTRRRGAAPPGLRSEERGTSDERRGKAAR